MQAHKVKAYKKGRKVYMGKEQHGREGEQEKEE